MGDTSEQHPSPGAGRCVPLEDGCGLSSPGEEAWPQCPRYAESVVSELFLQA